MAAAEPRRLRSDVLTMVGARAVVGLLNAGIVVLIARSLGPAGQGRVAVALTTLLVAVQLGNLGLSSAITVWAVRASTLPRVIAAVLWWSLAIGLVLGASVAALVVATDVLSLGVNEALVVAVATPFVAGAALLQAVLLGQGRARIMNLAEALSALAAFGMVALALAVLEPGPAGALAAAVSQFVLMFGAYLFLIRADLPRRPRLDTRLTRDLLMFSRWPFAAGLLTFLLIRVDVLVVDAVLGAAAAGRYAVAVTISQAVYLLPLSVGINLLPRAARGISYEAVARILRRLALPYAAVCLLLFAVADVVVDVIFGPEYQASATLLRLLLPGTFALGIAAVLSYYFAATGYPVGAVLAWGAGLVVDVLAVVLLLEPLGLEIAAIASSVTYIGVAAVALRLFLTRRECSPGSPVPQAAFGPDS